MDTDPPSTFQVLDHQDRVELVDDPPPPVALSIPVMTASPPRPSQPTALVQGDAQPAEPKPADLDVEPIREVKPSQRKRRGRPKRSC